MNSEMKKLIKLLMEQNHFTWPTTPISGFDVFMHCLRNTAIAKTDILFGFLDNCMARCVKKTVLYADLLDNVVRMKGENEENTLPGSQPDLLMITFMEQLSYLVVRYEEESMVPVAGFLRLYIDYSLLRGVSRQMLILLRDKMQSCFEKDEDCFCILGKALQEPLAGDLRQDFDQLRLASTREQHHATPPIVSTPLKEEVKADLPSGPPIEDKDHLGLTRWIREDIQDAIADESIAELFLCLCSEFEEIRKQALTGIGKFMQKLPVSFLWISIFAGLC